MIIYVVDPMKRITKTGKKRASGIKDKKDSFQVRRLKRTSKEDNRVKDKYEVSVDSVARAARLGASSRGAANRVSTRQKRKEKGHALTE